MIQLVTAEVIIGLRDETGTVGRIIAHVGANVEIAPARAAALQLAGLAVAISGCVLVSVGVTYTTYIREGRPPPGPPVTDRAVFVFGTDDAGEYAVVAVPGVLADLVDDAGEIDPAQPAIADFVEAIIDGPWINPFDEDITTLEASYYEFKP